LILLNGAFSAAEVSLISANQNRIRKKAEDGDQTAVLLREMVNNPSGVLATIQIFVSLIALFSGALAAVFFSEPATAYLSKMELPVSEKALSSLVILFITLVLSYFTLVFGELVPKRFAMKNADRLAPYVIRPVLFLSRAMKPFVGLLSATTNLFARMVGVGQSQEAGDVTEEEIRMMVDVGGEAGTIDENEMEMINNVFEFDDKTAGDICTHRMDIFALPKDMDLEELAEAIQNEKHSRIPVYDESMDDIVGVLHVKDLMARIIRESRAPLDLDLSDIMRKPYFVPFSKKTDELFEEMRKNKQHMSVVLDEYGGTLGIVTMEDLIEEVMGNIADEYDVEEKPDIESAGEGAALVNGGADLSEVAEYFGIDLPEDGYNTLGGFLISLIGRIPEDEEKPELEYNGLIFSVLKMEDKRISEVRVIKRRD